MEPQYCEPFQRLLDNVDFRANRTVSQEQMELLLGFIHLPPFAIFPPIPDLRDNLILAIFISFKAKNASQNAELEKLKKQFHQKDAQMST